MRRLGWRHAFYGACVGWSLIMLAALASEWSVTNVLVTFGVWLLAPSVVAGIVFVVKKIDED